MAADAVVGLRGVVAVDEAGGGETAFFGGQEDAVHGAQEAGVVGGDEEDEGGDEDGGVEGVAAFVGLHEELEGLAVACGGLVVLVVGGRGRGVTFLHYLLVNLVACFHPCRAIGAG